MIVTIDLTRNLSLEKNILTIIILLYNIQRKTSLVVMCVKEHLVRDIWLA